MTLKYELLKRLVKAANIKERWAGMSTEKLLENRRRENAKNRIPALKDDAFVISRTEVMGCPVLKLLGRIQKQKKLPPLLKLYTRADDEKLLRQFSAVPKNISPVTLQNCARESLRLYEEIDRYEPDPGAKVGVWYGAKEPNMKKALRKLRRAFPNAELHPFPGFGHGEIIAHPERMAAEIRRFMGDDRA